LERLRLRTPADAAALALGEMSALEQEELRALLLDARLGVLKFHTVCAGAVDRASVRIAEIFREAVRLNATAIIVLHNHPSGDPSPSDVIWRKKSNRNGRLH
jgi:DNA repair protein RadC